MWSPDPTPEAPVNPGLGWSPTGPVIPVNSELGWWVKLQLLAVLSFDEVS